MTHIRVTIDGQTKMDGDLGQWTEQPRPVGDMMAEIKANTRNAPWMRTILDLIAKAAMIGKGFTAEVSTRPDGYALSVWENL